MSDTSSIPSRLLNTPMRDLLRLRLTGRLAWREAVRRSELPVEVQTLIEAVVQRTRLWRLEKAEVAEELLAHFADGFALGMTTAKLILVFGDIRLAARLIRRAQVRKRGVTWTIVRAVRWLAALLAVLLGVRVAFYYAETPRITINYFADLNRAAEQAGPDNRAWPIYQEAIALMGKPGSLPWTAPAADSPQDRQLMHWVARHPETIELIRQGSSKPVLGYLIGPAGPAGAGADVIHGLGVPPSTHFGLMATFLPFLAPIYHLAQLAVCDIHLAANAHDGQRAMLDLTALLDMADQLRGPDNFEVSCMTGMSVDLKAYAAMDGILASQPALLRDDQLIEFAHRIAGPKSAADLVNLRPERMMMADLVQRVFSDDGHGNGYITADGVRLLKNAGPLVGWPDAPPEFGRGPVPLISLTLVSRDEFISVWNKWMDEQEALMHEPLRTNNGAAFDQRICAIKESRYDQLRFGPLLSLLPGDEFPRAGAERMLGRRDGILIGIALELYRRRHGEYPASLAELSPLLLPTLPVDPFTGGQLHYRLRDGKPLVYSVGADRVDDGGIPVRTAGEIEPNSNAAAYFFGGTPPHGDWILYPQSEFDRGN